MFKLLSLTLLLAISFQGDTATVLLPNDNVLNILTHHVHSQPQGSPDISPIWVKHIKDFVDLIDVDKLLAVAIGHLSDPEVLNFVTFLFSDDFKKTVFEFESLSEFKENFTKRDDRFLKTKRVNYGHESLAHLIGYDQHKESVIMKKAIEFLVNKGYEVDSIINYINDALEIMPFQKPRKNFFLHKSGKGINGLIEDLIAALPLEEFKRLFESKLETSPEVAELFETINSPEFMDIMRRMSKDPKFVEFKEKFENFGFDFKYLCYVAKEFFGKYYQGVFCG